MNTEEYDISREIVSASELAQVAEALQIGYYKTLKVLSTSLRDAVNKSNGAVRHIHVHDMPREVIALLEKRGYVVVSVDTPQIPQYMRSTLVPKWTHRIQW